MQTRNLLSCLCISIISLFGANMGICEQVVSGIAEAEYAASERESPYDARLQAKKVALQGFVEEVVGIQVTSWQMLFESEDSDGVSEYMHSLIDIWASAYVRVDSVHEDGYENYVARYVASVSVPASEVKNFLEDVEEIKIATRETRKRELIEHTKHRYAVTAEVEDMVLVPAQNGEPPFYIDRHPVSVVQYRRFNKMYKSNFFYLEPATSIYWSDACDYCSSQGKLLPTDIEWERARESSSSLSIEYISGDYVGYDGQKIVLVDSRLYARANQSHKFENPDLQYLDLSSGKKRFYVSFARRYSYEWVRLQSSNIDNAPKVNKKEKNPIKFLARGWRRLVGPNPNFKPT